MSNTITWAQFTAAVRAGAYGTGATITTSAGGQVQKVETVTKSGVRVTTPTQPTPTQQEQNTQGSVAQLAERYGGYNQIPQAEYDKLNQQFGTSYTGGTSGPVKTPETQTQVDKLELKSTPQEQQEQNIQAQKQTQETPFNFRNFQNQTQAPATRPPQTTTPNTKLESTAMRLEAKEKQIAAQTKGWKQVIFGADRLLDSKESDGKFVSTAKGLANTAWGLTVGFATGTTGASLILTAEKAVFMGRSAITGVSQSIKTGETALYDTVKASAKEQSFQAIDAITPVKVQSLREGKGFEYDPQGTATIIAAAAFAGVKTAAAQAKAKVDPNYTTPGKKFIDANKGMISDKSAAVKGSSGARQSPLSKQQIRQQSYGQSPYKNVGKVRYDQGEFVSKSPKKAGGQESIRFNPQNKEVSVINKKSLGKDVGSVETRTTYRPGGQTSQEFKLLPKGPAKTIGGKDFSRPPSQVQTIKPIQSGNSGQLSQIQKQIQRTSFEQTKYPKSPRETTTITKPTSKTPTQQIIKPVKPSQETTGPMQRISTDGRGSVRAKLMQKLQEQRARRDLEIRRTSEATQRNFDSNVDLSKVKFLQEKAPVQPKVTPKPPNSLEVLEKPGAVASKSKYSTEAMLEGKGFVKTTGVESTSSKGLGSRPESINIKSVQETAPTSIFGPEPRNIQFIQTFGQTERQSSTQTQTPKLIIQSDSTQNIINVAPQELDRFTNSLLDSKTIQDTATKNESVLKKEGILIQDSSLVQESVLEPVQITRGGSGGRTPSPFKPPTPNTPPPISIIKPISPVKPPQDLMRPIKKQPPKKEPPKLPPPKFEFKFPSPKTPSKQPGFNVITRVGGKEVLISKQPLTKEQATNFGQFIVGTTARASFKLVPAGMEATGQFLGRGKAETFKQGKDDWIVEKRKYRISSPGEKREITYKGIFASKQSKKSKSIFGV